jgi:hypothetical protein
VEDLTKEELVEILTYYKNKTIDLELSYLMLQIKNKRELKKQKDISDKMYNDLNTNWHQQNNENIKNFTKKIDKLNLELKKYKVKKINKKTTGE